MINISVSLFIHFFLISFLFILLENIFFSALFEFVFSKKMYLKDLVNERENLDLNYNLVKKRIEDLNFNIKQLSDDRLLFFSRHCYVNCVYCSNTNKTFDNHLNKSNCSMIIYRNIGKRLAKVVLNG
jgi:hypothetical protein